ncbi:hypothetical protein [Acinetobacter brisouii]|jgi:hypothetical protein|uniref:hypothetical protein n=1 Tax=Acinetobacter brisouii TaxID=396323 RepID=UPI00124C4984|nr:hypothetical protein [Acinetobacter brisouii]
MHETNKDKSFEVDQLHSVALKPEILNIFKEHSQSQQISIQVKLSSNELFTLQFNMDDLSAPDHLLTRTVSSAVESLLNQIPTILTVQNKV